MKYHPGLVALGILIAIGVVALPEPWNRTVILAIFAIAFFLKFGRMSAADWYKWTHEDYYGDLSNEDEQVYTKLKDKGQK